MNFQTKEAIERYYQGDKIQCLLCKKWFKSLGAHLNKVHYINVEKYKDIFGLPRGRGLCSCLTADKFRENRETRIADGKLPIGFISEAHEKKCHKLGPRKIYPLERKRRADQMTVIGSRHFHLNMEECQALLSKGFTHKQLAKIFGTSQTTISRFVKQANKYQKGGE